MLSVAEYDTLNIGEGSFEIGNSFSVKLHSINCFFDDVYTTCTSEQKQMCEHRSHKSGTKIIIS